MIGILAKDTVMKIESELAELPQLIRDVFSRVGDGAVRTNNDLV